MRLRLLRRYFSETYTIGTLYIDGVRFCDTLEDRTRDLNKDGDLDDHGEGKVYGKTSIPFGVYQVILKMSPRFKQELPRLLDVPGFEGILIHSGNTADDTAGCILVGENKIKGKVINSTYYKNELTTKIREAIQSGEKVYIEVA